MWIDDPDTGTRARLGMVGPEMAAMLAEQGNTRAARQAMSKPHFGFTLFKEF